MSGVNQNEILIAIVALASMVIARPVHAATVSDCQSQIQALQAQTASAQLFGQNAEKDRAGLQNKLSGASQALSLGKTADAIQKLTDFRTKVEQLNAQGKINPDDAATLISGGNEAIACVQSLSAS